MNTKHTPGPWIARQYRNAQPLDAACIIEAPDGTHIADVYGTDDVGAGEANAARIVQCVNAHDDLVVALRVMVERMERTGRDVENELDKRITAAARAALAKAGADHV
jgi:hypothetical protein